MKPCADCLVEIDHRNELPWFLNRYGLTGEFAEVGVFKASYSQTLLEHWTGKTLHLIDPYKQYPQSVYFDSTNLEDQEAVYREAQRNVARFGTRAHFMRMESLEAAPQFADCSLSGVFLDGNHKREFAAADIEVWFPKVMYGGLFSGHDFYTRKKDTDSDALNAVLDFAEKINVRPHVTWCNSWWFIKP